MELLGCELDAPVLTEESMRLGLSNELGANGRVNYLKNIIGLWLIQESRRAWRRQGREYSYAELESLALEAAPLRCFIDRTIAFTRREISRPACGNTARPQGSMYRKPWER